MSNSPVGKVGRVVVRVRGAGVPGEVVVSVQGTPETYLAYGAQEIAVGSNVLVVGCGRGRRVDVVPWQVAPPLG